MTIPEKDWKWYGFGGHYCLNKQCAFHLCTYIGD